MRVVRMRRWLLIGLAVLVVAGVIAGSRDGAWWEGMMRGKPLAFEVLTVAQLPLPLVEAYGAYRWEEGIDVHFEPGSGDLFILLRWGEKPTGGYRIEPLEVRLYRRPAGWQVRIEANYAEPEPGEPVIEVITFPAVGLRVLLDPVPNRFVVVVVDREGQEMVRSEPLP